MTDTVQTVAATVKTDATKFGAKQWAWIKANWKLVAVIAIPAALLGHCA